MPVMTQPGQSARAALEAPTSFYANTPTRGRSAGTTLPTSGLCGFLCRPQRGCAGQAPGKGGFTGVSRSEAPHLGDPGRRGGVMP